MRFLVDVAREHDCAIRVGVNCGSVDPEHEGTFPRGRRRRPMLESALEHCRLLDELGFTRYCVSLKDSDPRKVIEVNRRFAEARPDVPLHLGVTEAGMPPDGIIKTRIAFEQLISRGIGDTIRVSLTVPNARKHEEIDGGPPDPGRHRRRPRPLGAGSTTTAQHHQLPELLARRERGFVELAEQVKRDDRLRRAPRRSRSP